MPEEINFKRCINMLEKYIQVGDWKTAEEVYQSAAEARPNNPYLRAYAERINEESGEMLIPIGRTIIDAALR